MPDLWKPRSGCLDVADREEILVGIRGRRVAVGHRSTARPCPVDGLSCREVAANGGRAGYSAWHAHQRARTEARRPKPCKLRAGRLCDEVGERLQELWSPMEVSERLKLDYPDDSEMRVSHETIYQSLFVQGRGELRRELARCLRSGRATRRRLEAGVTGAVGSPGWSTSPNDPPRPTTEPCQAIGNLNGVVKPLERLGAAGVQVRLSRSRAHRTSTRRRARAMTACVWVWPCSRFLR